MKLLKYTIPVLFGLFLAFPVMAVPVSIPSATQQGEVPMGLTSGNYAAGKLIQGSNITINTSTPGFITISSTASGSGATTTIFSNITSNGPNFTFSTSSVTGLNLNITGSGSTITFNPQLQAGYNIPLTASTTQWNNFYNSPVTFLTAGSNIVLSSTSTIAVSATPSFTTLNVSGNSTLATTTDSGTLTVTPLVSCINLQTSVAGLFSCNNTVYLTANQSITLSGAVSGSGTTAITTAFASTTPVQNGGTGSTALTASDILYGNGTNPVATSSLFTFTAPLGLTVNATSTLATTTATALTVTGLTSLGNTSSTALTVSGLSVLATSSITGTLAVTGSTTITSLTGGVVQSTASGALYNAAVALGTQVSGVLPVGNGGTGATNMTIGDVLYGGGAVIATSSLFTFTSTGFTAPTTTITTTINQASGSTMSLLTLNGTYNISTNTTANIINISPNISSTASQTPATSVYMQNTLPTVNLLNATTTISSFYGSYAGLKFATGTITSYYGDYIDAPTVTASSTITNDYGLIVAGSASTTKYTVFNGIGTTTPNVPLVVVGSTTLTSLGAGCVNSTTSGALYVAACAAGGSGNSAWTIGNAVIYNATSTNNIGIGTSTPKQTLTIQGNGTTDLFNVSSSSGVSDLYVASNGSVGIGTNSPIAALYIQNNIAANPILQLVNASGQSGNEITASNFVVDSNGNISGPNNFSQGSNLGGLSAFGLDVGPTAGIAFHSDNGASGNRDVGLMRSAAGVLRVTNGTGNATNTDGSLIVGGSLAVGTSTLSSATLFVQGTSSSPSLNPFAVASSTGTNLLTITSKGNVGIGTTTPSFKFVNIGTAQLSGLTTSSSLQTAVLCLDANNQVISDSVACLASAKRYKENISPLNPGLNEVLQLNPVSYYFKPDFNGALQKNPNYNGIQYGLIADDVQKVDPNLVIVTTDPTTFEGKGYPSGAVQGLQSVNTWVGLFVKTFQDMEKQITAIIFRLNGDDAKIQALQTQVNQQAKSLKIMQQEIILLQEKK